MDREATELTGKPLLSILERIAFALESISESNQRMADHFDPSPPDIIGTPYLAGKLGCTTVWIAEMIRSGLIPDNCIVPGTGNGKPWKLYCGRIEAWLKSR